MLTIKVLGTGCHNCLELERRLAEVIAKMGRTNIQVERVDDERSIRHYIPLDAIPGLVIDGRLVSEREIPSVEILQDWLSEVPA